MGKTNKETKQQEKQRKELNKGDKKLGGPNRPAE
ncbi:spore protein [Bacillus sp. JCM 19034]|nr:spore protein [Bacillus sp. JCM 19034]